MPLRSANDTHSTFAPDLSTTRSIGALMTQKRLDSNTDNNLDSWNLERKTPTSSYHSFALLPIRSKLTYRFLSTFFFLRICWYDLSFHDGLSSLLSLCDQLYFAIETRLSPSNLCVRTGVDGQKDIVHSFPEVNRLPYVC